MIEVRHCTEGVIPFLLLRCGSGLLRTGNLEAMNQERKVKRTLEGNVSVVTGGGRGIGAAIAQNLAELGTKVVVCGRTKKPLETTVHTIVKSGFQAEAVVCDVMDLRSVESLAHQVEDKYGRLDVLVNNAGIGSFNSPLHDLPPEAWDKIFNTNLRGVYYCIRSLIPLMIRSGGGHVINISSLAGKNALPNGAAYSASKWGLNGLSYSIAEELRGHNIRVSVVCPGSTNTELSPHVGKSVAKMLQPDDIAHVVEMLVTQESQSFASEVLIRPTSKP